MKGLLGAIVAGVLLLPPLAGARDWRSGHGLALQAQGQPVKKKGPGSFQRSERDKQVERGERDKRHQNRLTPEQRRELNRDLDRANREIYRR